MNLKKIISGPLFWILLVVLGLLVVVPLLFGTSASGQQVDTNVGMELIEEGQVTEARIDDGDSRVDLSLTEAYEQDVVEYEPGQSVPAGGMAGDRDGDAPAAREPARTAETHVVPSGPSGHRGDRPEAATTSGAAPSGGAAGSGLSSADLIAQDLAERTSALPRASADERYYDGHDSTTSEDAWQLTGR